MDRRGARREGDEDYEAFFDECLPAVVALARRLTGDRVEAEDVAVEALGRAYAHWSKIRQLPYRRAWVLKVATHLTVDQSRRRLPPLRTSAMVGDEAEAVVLRAALLAALARLPRRQREAVALRYLADFSEAETASAMGLSAGSVKTHLSRGLRTLRGTFGDDIDTEGLLDAG